MSRRDFLKATAVASSTIALTTFPKPALSKNLKQYKMVTTWPKNFPGLGTAAQRFADRVKNLSDGQIHIKLFAAGELVPALEAFDAVASGAADLFHGASYYWQGKSKAFNFFASVPLGLTASEMNGWFYHGGGQKLWDDLAAQFNLKSFPCGNTGVQMGGWFNKEINTIKDFKGLKIRIPGLGGEVLRQLGATVVTLAGGEIFPALQSGAIDATEWIGPWNDLNFGFHKIAKHYYYPGFHEPGTTLELSMNLKKWNNLSETEKTLFQTATMAENNCTYAEFTEKNGQALNTLVNKHHINLKAFPDEVLQDIGKTAQEVVKNIAASDSYTQKVYDSYMKYRNEVTQWAKISDYAYYRARSLNL